MKRTEPSVHLYQGKPYRNADDTDVRLTWEESLRPDWRQAEVSEQQRFEEEQEQHHE